ncbi:MAG: hypothetical protein ABII22_02725 [Candidatus Micrarchaeota archaeon]
MHILPAKQPFKPKAPMHTSFSCCQSNPFNSGCMRVPDSPLIPQVSREYLAQHPWLTRERVHGRWCSEDSVRHAVRWFVEQHRLPLGHTLKVVTEQMLPSELRSCQYRACGLYGLFIHTLDGSNYQAMLFAGYDLEPGVRSPLELNALNRFGRESGLKYIESHPWIMNRMLFWNESLAVSAMKWLADQLALAEDDSARVAVGRQKSPSSIDRFDLRNNLLSHLLTVYGSATDSLALIGVSKYYNPALNLGTYAMQRV